MKMVSLQIPFLFLVTAKIALCLYDEDIRKELNMLKDTMSSEIAELRTENQNLKRQFAKLEKETKRKRRKCLYLPNIYPILIIMCC